MNLNNSAAPIQ